jgi:hypothetical protein
MLNEFRRALGASGFRRINNQLLSELLVHAPLNEISVAFMDATDLPANTEDKKNRPATGRRIGRHWERARGGLAKRASSLDTKNTHCGFGLAAIGQRLCSRRWFPGLRRRTSPRAICLNRAYGIAESACSGGRKSW